MNKTIESAELNKLAEEIHQAAKAKGFWQGVKHIGLLLMLVVTELSEALEADRKSHYVGTGLADFLVDSQDLGFEEAFELNIKDTFEDEMADAIIRMLDICGAYDIDIEKHIALKLEYNHTREAKHGKKY